jgi:hypothetical protein
MSFIIRTAAVASVCSLAGISGASAQLGDPVDNEESQIARKAALINAEASLVEAQNRMATARLGGIPRLRSRAATCNWDRTPVLRNRPS